jgi:membrane protein implicated in regulation of membrane protease activity
MSIRRYIFGVSASIALGIAMTFGIYFYAAFIYLLPVFSIIAVLIILVSIFLKKSKWKVGLQVLSFFFIAALTSTVIFRFLENRNRQHRNEAIAALYEYRQKTGKFPVSINYVPKEISNIKFNYSPDSTFTNFEFYFRDLYGIPHTFTSKDSLWKY